jgi:hypothetical protein
MLFMYGDYRRASKPEKERLRFRAVEMLNENFSHKEIAMFVGASLSMIYKWKKDFDRIGDIALEAKASINDSDEDVRTEAQERNAIIKDLKREDEQRIMSGGDMRRRENRPKIRSSKTTKKAYIIIDGKRVELN